MKVRYLPAQLIKPIIMTAVVLLFGFSLNACYQTPKDSDSSTKPVEKTVNVKPIINHDLYDFGEKNLAAFSEKLQNRKEPVHIVQLGDSHTAADFFSGVLRQSFQRQYGDAGLGFVPPSTIRGQRMATIKFTEPKQQWKLINSRIDEVDNFPLGGFILEPTQKNSALTLAQYTASDHSYALRTLYQSSTPTQLQSKQGNVELNAATNWQLSTAKTVKLPLTVQANGEVNDLQIGGWLLERERPGVMLSALGINGASINTFEKWQNDWQDQLQLLQPDMVILAYGTNEAFNDTLDINEYKQLLSQTIQDLRHNNPNAVVLLVGPNDSIKFKEADSCSAQQPMQLHNVIQAQRQVAKEQQAIFWDWQQYMGGNCSINNWIEQDLARADKVHLSRAGYERSAKALFDALQQVMMPN